MITESHTKENLNRSYVQAVAAKAGVNIELNGRSHDYGIDGTFHQVSLIKNKFVDSGISIDFQLKASTRCKVEANVISYPLDADTYNLLAERTVKTHAIPAILIILVLPKAPEDWLKHSEKQLILQNCCYWMEIHPPRTTNRNSVTIKIPREQMLTPECLHKLLKSVETNGKIKI